MKNVIYQMTFFISTPIKRMKYITKKAKDGKTKLCYKQYSDGKLERITQAEYLLKMKKNEEKIN